MSFEVQLAARSEVHTPPSVPHLTPAQRRGLKYQARVEKALEGHFPGRVLSRPWFRYKVKWKERYCQPDAVLFAEDWSRAVIIEVKASTIASSWKQLNDLYRPVVEKAYRIPIACVLVVPMFDPHVIFPGSPKIEQLEGLERLDHWREEGLGVVSWK